MNNKLAIKGALLALFGALTIGLGHLFGLDLDQVALLGVSLGGVIGLVPDRSQAERILGFLAGFVLAWAGFAVRAAVLPDTSLARAVVVFVLLLAAMGIAQATGSRIPLWSLLVGAAAMVGAYEQTYAASPSLFVQDSPTAATTVLLAAAMGVVGSMLLSDEVAARRESERKEPRHAEEVSP